MEVAVGGGVSLLVEVVVVFFGTPYFNIQQSIFHRFGCKRCYVRDENQHTQIAAVAIYRKQDWNILFVDFRRYHHHHHQR